jgi:hypothetical protein
MQQIPSPPEWKEIVEIIGFVAGLVALFLAFKQFDDARRHTKKLEQLLLDGKGQKDKMEAILIQAEIQQERLQDLADSLPTRFVGRFPQDLNAITRLLAGAKRKVDILCDFGGYGSFSAPVPFTEYFQEIRRRCLSQKEHPRVQIRLVIYTRRVADELLPLQFDSNEFQNTRQSQEFADFYTATGKQPAEKFGDWNSDMWDVEDDYRQALRVAGVQVRVADEPAPVFLWIRDGEELIGSFQSSRAFADFTFRTSDERFVEFFQRQFDDALETSQEYRPARAGNPPVLANPRGA